LLARRACKTVEQWLKVNRPMRKDEPVPKASEVETILRSHRLATAARLSAIIRTRPVKVTRCDGTVVKELTPKAVVHALLEHEGVAGAKIADPRVRHCKRCFKVLWANQCNYELCADCDCLCLVCGTVLPRRPKRGAYCKGCRPEKRKYKCADCGTSVTRRSPRCRPCSAKIYGKKTLATMMAKKVAQMSNAEPS
jgi:hypothetical protein